MQGNHTTDFKIGQVRVEFTKKHMTPYGGFVFIAKFFENIGLKEAVESFIPITEASNNSMGIFPKVLSFFLMTLAGGKRFSHLVCLDHSLEVFRKLFDQVKLPKAPTTITRFLGKIKSWQKMEEMSDKLWSYLFGIIPWDGITEDYISFDSSVITRYGNQEGAKKGYNPRKRGRPSHHPIFAFFSKSRYIVNAWNRAGNACSAENIIDFARQTFLRLGNRLKILGVLCDASFYAKHFIDFLENLNHKYVIAVKFYRTIQEKIISLDNWEKVDDKDDIELAEFEFCHSAEAWIHPRRYFAVRHRVKEDCPMPVGKQLKLFPDLEEVNEYRYSVYVTNYDDDATQLWRLYRRRCDDENRIKEIKEDFGLEGYCMQNFYATEAAILLRILLYNLFNLFRSILLPKAKHHSRLSTILYQYFTIPGLLGSDGNRKILRIGLSSKKQRGKFKHLLHTVARWFPPPRGEPQCI
jgi:DNA-directed RNA polymerase subunit N (RpoN/RPB10)